MPRTGALALAACLALTGCGGGDPPGTAAGTAAVSWTPNREAAVNAPGGGYRVYYATRSDFALADANSVDVPYAGGPRAPTSVRLDLGSGVYFVRVVAYSALEPAGSPPSAPLRVALP